MKVVVDNSKKLQFRYPFRVTCSRCKSVLEVEEGDIKTAGPQEYPEPSNGYSYVECAVCHASNKVTPPAMRYQPLAAPPQD